MILLKSNSLFFLLLSIATLPAFCSNPYASEHSQQKLASLVKQAREYGYTSPRLYRPRLYRTSPRFLSLPYYRRSILSLQQQTPQKSSSSYHPTILFGGNPVLDVSDLGDKDISYVVPQLIERAIYNYFNTISLQSLGITLPVSVEGKIHHISFTFKKTENKDYIQVIVKSSQLGPQLPQLNKSFFIKDRKSLEHAITNAIKIIAKYRPA